ncbi:hypothetical protein UFOVP839_26 [uncultured Caudovirales phage]|uniref:Uncharacterized protein n=1 Tax=uncultured Caudovirales phage TaxID=2100421 RepID=A0A6J5SL94_9CAUD|nr:hypothetical protein UFOVP839_26 [uncultured Caudovirales phage]CAB4183638.1 hypothetical protein UFOVP1100_43 [uncultured Caudovirales phage]CAB4214571.1 hypothetical protein UFOVP1461_46 [uncultured Caudovirales phage]CAB4219246.1 hypothetical protein UFOVP1612_4 [uncultured Caudovirales phage]
MALYLNLSATTQIKVGGGKLKGIMCSTAASSPTIAVYDSATAGTNAITMIAEFVPGAHTMYALTGDDSGIWFSKGLYVVIGGTVGVTFFYE